MKDALAAASTVSRASVAEQQPQWSDPDQVKQVRAILAARPPLVRLEDVLALRSLLGHVAAGQAHVIQAGDCAEDPDDCTREHIIRKGAMLDLLVGTLKMTTHSPVLRIGRIAGQYAKPRSAQVEQAGGRELPVYRGPMVNGPEPDPEARSADPLRILGCYMAAREVVEQLGWHRPGFGPAPSIEQPVWTSHEALLLDYELPMIRDLGGGQRWLSSTHFPWIGERTRQVDGAHVAMLAEVVNPVACKIGPGTDPAEVVALCDRLDPHREPGALTLIARLGADVVAGRLPALVEAVRRAGHPVIWLCDPMHGNTIAGPDGAKVRMVETITREVREFCAAVAAGGGVAGGLHLETTPEEVAECVEDASALRGTGRRVTSLCDPRLNPAQAISVVSSWPARLPMSRKEPEMAGLPAIAAYDLPTAGRLPRNVARWEIDAERAVLLIHDLQSYFVAPFPASFQAKLVRNVAALRQRCARSGVPVAYTAQPGRMAAADRGLLNDFWGPGMRAGDADRAIVPELAPAPGDWMFTKWRYSAFFRSDLGERMAGAGRDQLIVCGVYAHVGVLMTALDAFTHDIQAFLVADALGDFSPGYHQLALDYAAQRCAMVVSVADVLP